MPHPMEHLSRPPSDQGEAYYQEFSRALAEYLRRECGFTAADTRRVALRLLCVTEPRRAAGGPSSDPPLGR